MHVIHCYPSQRWIARLPQAISEIANRTFSHDVTAAILVFQNKEMTAMMVYQTNPLGSELCFYKNTFFFFSIVQCGCWSRE